MEAQHNDTLYMSIELSDKSWKLCFSDRQRKRIRKLPAGDMDGLLKEIALAKKRLRLAEDATVFSCYEAGRDGFWLHRFLAKNGIDNLILDPASIEVSRQKRRRKTDRLDAQKLVLVLIRRLVENDRTAASVVKVPSESEEDERRLHRERGRLKKERTAHINRMKSLLVLHGVRPKNVLGCDFSLLRDWEGKPLSPGLLQELEREQIRAVHIQKQIAEVEKERDKRLYEPQTESDRKAWLLYQLSGIGAVSAWQLSKEFFGWRRFQNRRQVGSLAGLTGTPYDSGGSTRDQGISKAGNARIRTLMIQLAWFWLRHQPRSDLTRWYKKRFGSGNGRMRRIGITALARKLLVALWKYVEKGEIPKGALLASR